MFTEVINAINERAAANDPPSPDDYFSDGLRYCGKCRTPKQYRGKPMVVCGKPINDGVYNIMCKCREKALAEGKKTEHDHDRRMYRERTLGAVKSRETFENSRDAEQFAYNVALGYARQFDRTSTHDGLLFCGASGCGKSYLCNAVLNHVADRDCSVYSTTIAAFERRLWNADKSELFQRVERVDLLLLDDLFAERSSDYMRQITFDILDVRIGAAKPLLITTNRTFDELMNGSTPEEKRILSRIHQGCNIVAMAGKDRRRERLVKNNDERIAELYNLGEGVSK